MRINTNMAALNAWRSMSVNEGNVQKSLEKLSSGYRINRAADDAAGLAMSEKMRGQIRGTNMAVRNAQDGISLVQTAEGSLTETHAILQRMRELSVQASNDTLTADDRTNMTTEMTALSDEIDRIGKTTKFNTTSLLDGNFSGMKMHVGANKDTNEDITISINDMTKTGLGVGALQIDSVTNAQNSVDTIDTAIGLVSNERANLGAIQNRMEHTVNSLQVTSENLSSAESRIRDVDMASEMASYTKNNILMQASQAMLAQANQGTQGILSLLR